MSHESHIAQESQTLMIILNVIHLNVGEVEAGCPEPLLVPGLHLGDAAVVGGGVQEVVGAVGGIVVVPVKYQPVSDGPAVLSDSPYKYRSVAASLLPLDDVGHHLVIGEVGVAVEVNRLAEYGSNVLGITISVAQN